MLRAKPRGGALKRLHIVRELENKGVAAAKTAPGAAFGKLEFKPHKPKHGNKRAGKAYEYRIEITFTPDAAVVKADEIAFIQTVRVVDAATGADKDMDKANRNRATGKGTSVDRRRWKEQGWYGLFDKDEAGDKMRPWKSAEPAKPAWMTDNPSWDSPNTTFEFETSVVCRFGADAGKVYATVTWGLSVDASLKVTPHAWQVTNKQSDEFTAAVGKWNEQAAFPDVERKNDLNQKPLPALK